MVVPLLLPDKVVDDEIGEVFEGVFFARIGAKAYGDSVVFGEDDEPVTAIAAVLDHDGLLARLSRGLDEPEQADARVCREAGGGGLLDPIGGEEVLAIVDQELPNLDQILGVDEEAVEEGAASGFVGEPSGRGDVEWFEQFAIEIEMKGFAGDAFESGGGEHDAGIVVEVFLARRSIDWKFQCCGEVVFRCSIFLCGAALIVPCIADTGAVGEQMA